MTRIQDLERRISSLQSTITARNRTISKLRGELEDASGQVDQLRGVLQEAANGLEPVGGLAARASALTDTLEALSDGGIRGIGAYGELLPLVTEGPLSHAREMAQLAVGRLGSLVGGSGEPGSKLRQTLTELVEEIEAIAGDIPELPPLPLRPMLGQVTALIQAAPPEMLARLDALWESSGLFDWVAAAGKYRADWGDALKETFFRNTEFHIARLEATISTCEVFGELLVADIGGGGEAAGGAGWAGGGGASVLLISLGRCTLGLVKSVLEILVIIMSAKVDVANEPWAC